MTKKGSGTKLKGHTIYHYVDGNVVLKDVKPKKHKCDSDDSSSDSDCDSDDDDDKGHGIVSTKPDLTQDEIIQSVIFNKRLWSVDHAKDWLIKNHLHAYNVDDAKHFYRFRQVNPSDIPESKYHYVTHKISNKGVELIIALRRIAPVKPIKVPKVKAIKGESLHTLNRSIRKVFKHIANGAKHTFTNPDLLPALTTIGTPVVAGLAGAAATFATGNPVAGIVAAKATDSIMHKYIPKKYYSSNPVITSIAGAADIGTQLATGGSIVKRGRGRPRKGTGVMVNNVEQLTPSEVIDRAIRNEMDVKEKYKKVITKNRVVKDKLMKDIAADNKRRIKKDLQLIDTKGESFGVRMARLRALKKAKV